jgi:nucleotide-binding universal stress UspA family protein
MYRKILVPLDGGATADFGLGEAVALAASLGARLCVLHVVTGFPLLVEMSASVNSEQARAAMERFGREMLDRAVATAAVQKVQAEGVLRELASGSVADVIVEEATRQGCDLIVMGTHGRRGLRRLTLGSDAELTVRNSPVPVMLVRVDVSSDVTSDDISDDT